MRVVGTPGKEFELHGKGRRVKGVGSKINSRKWRYRGYKGPWESFELHHGKSESGKGRKERGLTVKQREKG